MKPYWFKLIESDEPILIKPKTHVFLSLVIGVLIGSMGTYFLIPPKVTDVPIVQTSIVKPTTNPQPSIKNPMLNPSGNEDESDEEEDDD